jgi:hypothetical protein
VRIFGHFTFILWAVMETRMGGCCFAAKSHGDGKQDGSGELRGAVSGDGGIAGGDGGGGVGPGEWEAGDDAAASGGIGTAVRDGPVGF